jgi:hypothetical protein
LVAASGGLFGGEKDKRELADSNLAALSWRGHLLHIGGKQSSLIALSVFIAKQHRTGLGLSIFAAVVLRMEVV